MLISTTLHAGLGEQIARLDAPGIDFEDELGSAVAISGQHVVVGAPYQDTAEGGNESGAAYVFDASTGELLRRLVPDAGIEVFHHSRFGKYVAVKGGIALVGAYDANVGGVVDTGYVAIFDVQTGREISHLLPDDAHENMKFGGSLAMTSSYAVVTANAGRIFLFDISDPSDPIQLFELSDSGKVGISGSIIVISGAQSTTLFSTKDGSILGRIDFSGPLDIRGDRLVIGMPRDGEHGTDAGAAFLFDVSDPSSPELLQKIVASDAAAQSRFGSSVALFGDRLLTGAIYDGSAYLFDLTLGRQVAKLERCTSQHPWHFGTSVDLNATRAVVGSPFENDELPSAAFLFDVKAGGCTGDLDGDGSVTVIDLLILLDAWAECAPPGALTEPRNVVDVLDLITLLEAFGDCDDR